ncbi:MAG: hypothetical protein KDC52_00935 [Ignavibacteriae bacterium]|nr:hypothetical protein [Ignavibacteriota bacterium]
MSLRKFAVVFFSFIISFPTYSQRVETIPQLKERNLGGPRLGLTYVHGNGELFKTMKKNKMDRLVSQFGWHFEYQVSPTAAQGPSFVVQFIPLFGGVEYGKIVPSLTTAFGIRFLN